MEIVRGQTAKIKSTSWLDKDALSLADLTGATIKTMLKRSVNDLDAAAILTLQIGSGVAILAPASNGVCETTLTAAQTNVITYDIVYFEVVVKLANNEIIRSGVDRLEIKGNIQKTLP